MDSQANNPARKTDRPSFLKKIGTGRTVDQMALRMSQNKFKNDADWADEDDYEMAKDDSRWL